MRAEGSPGRWRYIVARGAQDCLAGSYGLYSGEAGGLAFYVFDGDRYVLSPTAPRRGRLGRRAGTTSPASSTA